MPTGQPAPLSPERRRQLAEARSPRSSRRLPRQPSGCDVIVGGNRPADRGSFGGGADGHSLRLRRLLPERAAIAPPRAASVAAFARTGAAGGGRQPRALGRGMRTRFNDLFGAALNSHRASIGLAPVSDVRSYVFTDRPWLAADATLAPWPDPRTRRCFRPAPGFCRTSVRCRLTWSRSSRPASHRSTSASAACARRQDLSRVMIESARALGRRAIVSRGWADLSLVDNEPDCLAVGEVEPAGALQAGRCGRPPRRRGHDDRGRAGRRATGRHSAALRPALLGQRVHALGIGTAHASGTPSTDSLTHALASSLRAEVAVRAQSIAAAVRRDGAHAAAQRLISGLV